MKRALVVLALLFLGSPLRADDCKGPMFPFAFEQITISSTALPLTQATAFPSGAQGASMAVVSVETNPIRYRSDGLNPTATVGMPAAAGLPITVCGEATLRRIKFIRQAADATLSVEYYREGTN